MCLWKKSTLGFYGLLCFFEITSLVRFIQLMRLPHHISVPDSVYIRQSAKNNLPIFIKGTLYITRGFSECSRSSFSVTLSVSSFLCSLWSESGSYWSCQFCCYWLISPYVCVWRPFPPSLTVIFSKLIFHLPQTGYT